MMNKERAYRAVAALERGSGLGILWLLRLRGAPASRTWLAGQLGRDVKTVGKGLDFLEGAGYVQRVDYRHWDLAPERAGRDGLALLLPPAQAGEFPLSDLGAEEEEIPFSSPASAERGANPFSDLGAEGGEIPFSASAEPEKGKNPPSAPAPSEEGENPFSAPQPQEGKDPLSGNAEVEKGANPFSSTAAQEGEIPLSVSTGPEKGENPFSDPQVQEGKNPLSASAGVKEGEIPLSERAPGALERAEKGVNPPLAAGERSQEGENPLSRSEKGNLSASDRATTTTCSSRSSRGKVFSVKVAAGQNQVVVGSNVQEALQTAHDAGTAGAEQASEQEAQRAAMEAQAQRELAAVRALRAAGIGEPVRAQLAALPHVTPLYVRAMAARVQNHHEENKRNTSFLVHIIRAADPMPDYCDECSALDGEHAEHCSQYKSPYEHYVSGPYADLIDH